MMRGPLRSGAPGKPTNEPGYAFVQADARGRVAWNFPHGRKAVLPGIA
jgi:hypothetical protein